MTESIEDRVSRLERVAARILDGIIDPPVISNGNGDIVPLGLPVPLDEAKALLEELETRQD